MPTLRRVLALLLHHAYSRATKVHVRAAVQESAATLLTDAVREEDRAERVGKGEVAGTFLGTAARVESQVGFEPDVAAELSTALDRLSSAIPGKGKLALKGVAAILGAMRSNETKNPSWTMQVVDALLYKIYAAAHARPEGPVEDPAVQEYDWNAREWRREPARAFREAFTNKENG
jgi:hypothetical protein